MMLPPAENDALAHNLRLLFSCSGDAEPNQWENTRAGLSAQHGAALFFRWTPHGQGQPVTNSGGSFTPFRVSTASSVAVLMLCITILGCSAEQPAPQPTRDPPVTAAQQPQPVSSRKETLPAILERGELRVGMQIGYVPFEMAGPDGYACGFDVDAAHVVAKGLGVSLRLVRQNWQALIPSLLEGRIDLIMSGMTITPERNTQVVFTDPVVETGRMFLVHKNNRERFKYIRDLNSPDVFIVAGKAGLGDLRLKELLPKAGFREFPDSRLALEEVLHARAHAFVDEEFTVRMACARHAGKLMSNFEPLTYEPIAWAIRPGDVHWLNWLNNFILRMRKDGTLDGLKVKWLRDYFLDLKPHTPQGSVTPQSRFAPPRSVRLGPVA